MPRLNPFLNDDDDDGEDPLDRLGPLTPLTDEDLTETAARGSEKLIEELQEGLEGIDDEAVADLGFLRQDEGAEEQSGLMVETTERRSEERGAARPLGAENLRQTLEEDPLFEESLQERIREQMEQPDQQLDEELRRRQLDQLVQNTIRSELGGLDTARGFLRQGSGVG